MHQVRFRLGLRQDPAGGAFSALQKSYLDLKGPTSNGGREKGRGARARKERERRRRGEVREKEVRVSKFGIPTEMAGHP